MEIEPLFVDPAGADYIAKILEMPDHIALQRPGENVMNLSAAPGQIRVVEMHPTVDQMQGDWGAICEVFRNSNYYYLSIQGVSLKVGDHIEVYSQKQAAIAIFHVIDLEDGQARIEAPEIKPWASH